MSEMLQGYRCNDCNSLYLIIMPLCPNCGNAVIGSEQVSGYGVVRSCTTIHVAPARFSDDVPYTVVLVELDQGPKLIGRLKRGETVVTGARVFCMDPYDGRGVCVENTPTCMS